MQDRVRGAILGAACGSTLGGSSIGLNHKEIMGTVGGLKDFTAGLSKSFLPDHQAGALLADTFMALALAESLVANAGKLNIDDLKKRYGALLADDVFVKAAPGVPCIAGLRRLADGETGYEEGPEALHANCASRTLAAGCLPGGAKSDEPVDVAVKQARLSHLDGRALAAAAVVADSIHFFIEGARLSSGEDVRNYVKREYELANKYDVRFGESWDDVAPDLNYEQPAEDLPYSLVNVESSVLELIPTAVGIFLIFRHSLEEAVCAAARSGGDTDTVACLVGALSGAYHGASGIPQRWLDKLEGRERLEKAADALAKLWA